MPYAFAPKLQEKRQHFLTCLQRFFSPALTKAKNCNLIGYHREKEIGPRSPKHNLKKDAEDKWKMGPTRFCTNNADVFSEVSETEVYFFLNFRHILKFNWRVEHQIVN